METFGVVHFQGCSYFRQRLSLSCLSGKPITIKNIRESDGENLGIKEYEASFIRLIDKLSNGSKIVVDETGTCLRFTPGILMGGKIQHNCGQQRGIGYFLEPLMMLGPFCKKPLNVTLYGITNNDVDPSIDMIRYSLLPVLSKLLRTDEGLTLKLLKRGLPLKSKGEVFFSCPVKRSLQAFQWLESGKIKKIRGVAYSSRVAPTVANRMIESAKGVFYNCLTDVYFTCDNAKGDEPGYGMCCSAETNKGTIYCAEALSSKEFQDMKLPEDVGQEAAFRLMEEISRGGIVDSMSQSLVLLFMTLTPKDVSKVVFGPLSPYTMHFLRHLRDFFNIVFKIDEYSERDILDEGSEFQTGAPKLLLTCVGVGYSNIAKGQT